MVNAYPITTALIVAANPGSIKLWFNIYLPIVVVPERSKLIAASITGWLGRKNKPLTAGNIATRCIGGIPKEIPNGNKALTVAAWLTKKIDNKNK